MGTFVLGNWGGLVDNRFLMPWKVLAGGRVYVYQGFKISCYLFTASLPPF